VDEDWRIRITFDDHAAASEHASRLEAKQVGEDEQDELGDRVVVSRNDAELFLYAATERDARLAEQLARAELEADNWPGDIELTRWHDEAEDWEPVDRPLPRSAEEREAERERLMKREDEETAAAGHSEWEVRAELPSHREARELSDRLNAEGVSHVRRWRYLLVGATDEDAAKAWADRIRSEAPADARVSVEGTFASAEAHNPFAAFTGVGSGL
jgi:hypothetical protein